MKRIFAIFIVVLTTTSIGISNDFTTESEKTKIPDWTWFKINAIGFTMEDTDLVVYEAYGSAGGNTNGVNASVAYIHFHPIKGYCLDWAYHNLDINVTIYRDNAVYAYGRASSFPSVFIPSITVNVTKQNTPPDDY